MVLLFVNMLILQKRQQNIPSLPLIATSLNISTQILTKKSHFAPLMPLMGKAGVVITKGIAENFYPLPLYFQPSLIKLPLLDRLWIVLADLKSLQYLKNVTTYKEYAHLVKYVYGRFVLVV